MLKHVFVALQDNQCGIVTNIDIECAVKLVGTNCVLYPVNSKELQHIWVRAGIQMKVLSYSLGRGFVKNSTVPPLFPTLLIDLLL